MTSLVTTLTLMMIFNAIVFAGETTVSVRCRIISDSFITCLKLKWNVENAMKIEDIGSDSQCCLHLNDICGSKLLIREDVCEEPKSMRNITKIIEQKCNQYKDCNHVKTYPMDETCNEYKKYTNCLNRSHHSSCGPLLVITSIAIVIVIQLFS